MFRARVSVRALVLIAACGWQLVEARPSPAQCAPNCAFDLVTGVRDSNGFPLTRNGLPGYPGQKPTHRSRAFPPAPRGEPGVSADDSPPTA